MARRVHSSRLTLDRRDELEAKKLETAKEFLFRIRNELDPDGFTIEEIAEEFGSVFEEIGNEQARQLGLRRKPTTAEVFKEQLGVLVEYGYVEKTGRGVTASYSITEMGRDLEE